MFQGSVQGHINQIEEKLRKFKLRLDEIEEEAQKIYGQRDRLIGGIKMALSELGVPGPETPSPVCEAVDQLKAALSDVKESMER